MISSSSSLPIAPWSKKSNASVLIYLPMGWGDLGSTTMDTVVPDDVLADEDEQELLLLRGGGVAGLHGRDGVFELSSCSYRRLWCYSSVCKAYHRQQRQHHIDG